MKRTASAHWSGDGKTGKGTLTTQSGVFENQPYNFTQRFENEDGRLGTNPEELVAAAHAGCFTMALAFQLQGAGYVASVLDTKATLSGSRDDVGFKIDKVVLELSASIDGISQDDFDRLTGNAKNNCPVSRLLRCEIVLHTTLNG